MKKLLASFIRLFEPKEREERFQSSDSIVTEGPARRTILQYLAGAMSGVFAFLYIPKLFVKDLLNQHSTGKVQLPKWGMVIDLDKCTTCGGCVVSCRAENNVPIAGADQADKARMIFWMDILVEQEGEYPDIKMRGMPTPCNHCENAPCVKVCPVGATYISEEGIVAQIWARCIGCRYCTTACPYTRRYFNWEAPQWSEEYKNQLNPDVATRPKGVVEKCTFCHHRIRKIREQAKIEGQALTDENFRYLPACAQACPAKAITFGDLNNPNSEVSRLKKSPRAFHLQEELGTNPKVTYLRSAKWKE